MTCKCAQCGALLDGKRREVRINGVKRYFCPTRYSPLAEGCLTKYIREHREGLFQYHEMGTVF